SKRSVSTSWEMRPAQPASRRENPSSRRGNNWREPRHFFPEPGAHVHFLRAQIFRRCKACRFFEPAAETVTCARSTIAQTRQKENVKGVETSRCQARTRNRWRRFTEPPLFCVCGRGAGFWRM